MDAHNVDVIIIGAGIAGLWTAVHLRNLGYDVLLLERDAIGSGQTIASQGIIHSGFKYTLAGKLNALSKTMSDMPSRWQDTIFSGLINSPVHHLMIPKTLMGAMMKAGTQHAFSGHIENLEQLEWKHMSNVTGFKGTFMALKEPVFDVPGVLRHLSVFCRAKKIEQGIQIVQSDNKTVKGVWLGTDYFTTKVIIHTSAASNLETARTMGHDNGLVTQTRPLLMGMIRNAPFPLFTHLIGSSDKPIATITTHTASDGKRIWYVGGNVAERPKNDWPHLVYQAIKKAFMSYLPAIDYSGLEWAVHPVDRIEGKAGTTWLPDTPVIHEIGNSLYCWPTKLAFAPLLADRIESALLKLNIRPSGADVDRDFLMDAPLATTPWDKATWTKLN
jgi:hypothetical protein